VPRNASDDDQHLHELATEIEHLNQELAHFSTIVHHPDDSPSVFAQRRALQAQLQRALDTQDAHTGISGQGSHSSSMTTDTESQWNGH